MIEIKNLKGQVNKEIDADDLYGADLHYADLYGADLHYADLRGADLYGADLHYADLRGADLRGADLHDVKYNEYTAFLALQCPEEGPFIAFKIVDNYIVKLLIPEGAKRSSATTRKCRASKAKVISIYNINTKENIYCIENTNYVTTEYKVGEMVYPDSWDEDRWNECSHGIHFFITEQEAINY